MEHAAVYERMGDDPLPFLEAAYHLGSRGMYLIEETYSKWAEARREELAACQRKQKLSMQFHKLVHLSLWLCRSTINSCNLGWCPIE